MPKDYEIIDITPENVDEYDLFCKKSKKKEEGYQQKMQWFKDRYSEGLRLKLLHVNERGKMTSRGMIEYIPGEHAWRAVNAKDYILIQCLWVVGQAKKKGFGSKLIEICIEDAEKQGKAGVAMVSSSFHWLANKKIFLKNGFDVVDNALPTFELLVKKFKDIGDPSFPKDWTKRQKKYGSGLTIVYTKQCPYIPDAIKIILDTAKEEGIKSKAVELQSAKDVQASSPSPYGSFGIVYNGQLLSYTYMKKKDLLQAISDSS